MGGGLLARAHLPFVLATLAMAVTTAVAGVWSDRRGAAAPLRLGVVAFAVASAAPGPAEGIVPFVLARLVGGIVLAAAGAVAGVLGSGRARPEPADGARHSPPSFGARRPW